LDETGLMLQPLVRRTWAPQGTRPVLYCWDRHDRLSVIAALTLSTQRRRIGLYFAIHGRNLQTAEVVGFLRQVQRHLRRPLLIVTDRLPAHRSAARRLGADARFAFSWLPAYAPDLNPVEAIWSQTKHSDLANYVPEDVLDLEVETELALEATESQPRLLRSFFQAASLKL